MRGSVIGSGLVHLALLVAIFVVRSSAPLIVAGPDVVQVALVDPSRLVAVSPPAPPREPPPPSRAPEIRPEKDAGVKLAPEKKKPEPKKPEEKPPPEPAEPQPALPYASVGNAGLRASVSVGQGNFEFGYYLLQVRNKVAQNWSPPAGLVAAGKPVRAVVYFRIARNGRLAGFKLESGSRNEFFDRQALRAVLLSDPMPPLPVGYNGSDLGVHFGFEYESP